MKIHIGERSVTDSW